MKSKLFILSIVFCSLIIACRKEEQAIDMLASGFGWRVEKFYVNDVDRTDSLLALTINGSGPFEGGPWTHSFSHDDYHITGPVRGYWSSENNVSVFNTTITASDTTHAGPFLSIGTTITWDFNYDKLCDDDEIWITTTFNNKKYEVHFMHIY